MVINIVFGCFGHARQFLQYTQKHFKNKQYGSLSMKRTICRNDYLPFYLVVAVYKRSAHIILREHRQGAWARVSRRRFLTSFSTSKWNAKNLKNADLQDLKTGFHMIVNFRNAIAEVLRISEKKKNSVISTPLQQP